MTDKKICNDQECKCPYHKNENGFEIDSIIQTNPNDNSNFIVAKKHLNNVKQIIIKKNHQTNHKKVELMGEAKAEIKPKKPGRKRTIEEIYEFLQREGQKNEEFRNKQEQWNQKQNGRMGNFEKRMDNFDNQIQYLIETSLLTLQYFLIIFQLPTIKKELIAMGYNPEEMNQKIQNQIEKSKEVVKKKDEDN